MESLNKKYLSCKKVIPQIYYLIAKGDNSFTIRKKLSEIFDTKFSRHRFKYFMEKGKEVGLWDRVCPTWRNIFDNEFYINRIVTIEGDKKYDMVVQVQNLTNCIIVRPNNYILTIPLTSSIGNIGNFLKLMSKKMNHNIWSNSSYSKIVYFRNHNDKTLLCGLRKSFYCVVFNEIEADMLISDVKKRIISEVNRFVDFRSVRSSVDMDNLEWVNGEDAIRHPYLKKFLTKQTTFKNDFIKKVYKRNDEFEIMGTEEERTLRRERAITNLTVVPYADQINKKLDFLLRSVDKLATSNVVMNGRLDSLTNKVIVPFFTKLGMDFSIGSDKNLKQKSLKDYIKEPEKIDYIG